MKEPVPLSDSLDRVLRGLGSPGVRASISVFSAWADIVGTVAAEHSEPVSLDGSCLLVVVDAPAWATRLRFAEADIVRRCTQVLSETVVTRVEVRVKPAGKAFSDTPSG